MTSTTIDAHEPLTAARYLLRQIDRQLHEVIDYTDAADVDPVKAAQLMDRFGDVYQDLGYRRFTGLLLSLDTEQPPSGDADQPSAGDPSEPPTQD